MKVCPTCQRTYEDELAFCLLDGTRLQSNAAPRAGEVFDGQYVIEALIAQTRTGQLYRARHLLLGNHVALKLFTPELRSEIAEWMRRFQRECQAAHRFRHPNAVAVYDLRAEYLVMEYVKGQTLDKKLRECGRFTHGEVFAVLEPVARALEAARASGVTCDFLTPADILIEQAESDLLSVKLLPLIFNQRSIDDRLGAFSTGGVSDTQAIAAPYVAPNLLDNGTVPAKESDIVYSLGVLSYELASGQKPFDGLTVEEIARKQATGQPAPLSELVPEMPAAVARVIERAMAKDEKDRPATVMEFVSSFKDALGVKRDAIETPWRVGSAIQSRTAEATGQPLDAEELLAEARCGADIKTKSLEDGSQPVGVSATDKPLYTDENVQFTVYQPEAVAPARWYTLLAFAHLSKRRADAPPDEPEPLAEVKRIAERVLADERADYDAVKQNSLHAIPHRGEITFVPEIAGCEFNPPRQSFSWQKSVHKVEFEMLASASLDGQMARGRLTVFLGSLILADVPLAIRVDSAASERSPAKVPTVPASAVPYRKIFPSYSHKDRAIVEQVEHHVHALGDKYLRDVTELRAGQDWQRWMREAIEEADMFQLFWSHNSMRSVYVRQEWEYALSLGRPNFVRPTYWEEPLPENPEENLPPAELRQLHFQHLRANSGTDRATLKEVNDSQPTTQRGLPTERAGRGGASGYIPSDGAVVCPRCGSRYSPGTAFCQRCGGTLSAGAETYGLQVAGQLPPQTATTPTPQPGSAPNVFWETPAPEITPGHAWPSQPYIQPQSSRAASGRTWLLVGLLLFVFLLLGIAVGIYLLVRFL